MPYPATVRNSGVSPCGKGIFFWPTLMLSPYLFIGAIQILTIYSLVQVQEACVSLPVSKGRIGYGYLLCYDLFSQLAFWHIMWLKVACFRTCFWIHFFFLFFPLPVALPPEKIDGICSGDEKKAEKESDTHTSAKKQLKFEVRPTFFAQRTV